MIKKKIFNQLLKKKQKKKKKEKHTQKRDHSLAKVALCYANSFVVDYGASWTTTADEICSQKIFAERCPTWTHVLLGRSRVPVNYKCKKSFLFLVLGDFLSISIS